ncbi:lipoprotein signal peptidase [Saprospiraceae bacterium]|nr:lipoprotein signal peptidase [Saprospiraceae bacterium]MDB4824365.1 lipoprotein signal peptidase [Saprospiraceae bacterium]MDB9914582.1 lipoprotein signal peptidase [Saprospiraceae bacterium]MDC1306061.1 lipoprotein signal peptidase [Saprospiraceae bacterium]MDC1308959.1 lipoprotein signal peptidase [Saprospiraceae bacterium]
MKRTTLIFFTIIVVLIIDQWLKVHIKLTYPIGEGFKMFGQDWARIHFVENKGMAFGLEMGGAAGKYALSIFRILMVGLLGYIIKGLVQVKESKWLIVCFSLIIAGAIGNIIDSMVYGLIFSASSFHGPVAQFMPESGGYAPFLQGKVVDMFHFPMVTTTWPEWVPKWGGSSFEFFRPVFNVADAAISVGVIAILLFHRRFFTKPEDVKIQSETTSTATSNVGSSEEE